MPEIEVFLMFAPSDRNGKKFSDGSTTTEPGPDWKAIGVQIGRTGYTLKIHGPSIHPTVNEIQESMKNAEVTLLVGHGSGSTDTSGPGPKWISDQIKLDDGMIASPNGLYQGKWNGGTLKESTKPAKVTLTNVTGIFTCNSYTKLPDAFDQQTGSHLVTNDGGPDGMTRVGTLELGAAEFVKEYARTKGDVSRAMRKAQVLFIAKAEEWKKDKGDTLHDKPSPPAAKVQSPVAPYTDFPTGGRIINEVPR